MKKLLAFILLFTPHFPQFNNFPTTQSVGGLANPFGPSQNSLQSNIFPTTQNPFNQQVINSKQNIFIYSNNHNLKLFFLGVKAEKK